MKLLLPLMLAGVSSILTFGQGTVSFNNRVAGVVDARFFIGNAPFGAGWTAQLFGGPETPNINDLLPLFPTTTFNTSTSADLGYLNPVVVAVPNVPAGAKATLAIRVFSDTLPACFASGGPVTVTLGGGGLPPANLISLRPIDFAPDLECIPEPSVFLLGLFGAGLFFMFRQKQVRPT
jgi:hypothetical protein